MGEKRIFVFQIRRSRDSCMAILNNTIVSQLGTKFHHKIWHTKQQLSPNRTTEGILFDALIQRILSHSNVIFIPIQVYFKLSYVSLTTLL